jgi:4'-phosphopantetheinyl transferase
MTSAIKIETFSFPNAERSGEFGLRQRVIHVWTRSLDAEDAAIRQGYDLLSSEERGRAERFRVDRPRNDFILTRSALRLLLAQYATTTPERLQFKVTKYGKPGLEGVSDLRFNVSHTEGMALLAFTRGREIGVDVERIRPEPDARRLSERFFSVSEREALRPLRSEELQAAFFRCWSRKEAYIKARGEGLSLPLAQFDVAVEADARRILQATRPDARLAEDWCVCNLAIASEYAAAVAFEA